MLIIQLSYDETCRDIFNHPNKKIIIVGRADRELPIPRMSKYYIGEPIVGYRKLDIENIDRVLQNTNSSTFAIDGFKGDVFKLWYYSDNTKPEIRKTRDIIDLLFKDESIDDAKLWEDTITIKNYKQFPKHADKIDNADLSWPIILYKNTQSAERKQVSYSLSAERKQVSYSLSAERKQVSYSLSAERKQVSYSLCDGMHRLVYAYLNNIPDIRVKFISRDVLEKTVI